eukprot:TRINITY_DN532_c0_g1_i1.p1 TRINITY_DN532_c0_g1~~TRINITY_DN532_c0_g1_i1.p1  ORF type:complete len:515 (-),score=253.83 TRINITY_DN532_c0_g1_i1:71-1573(-)
MAAILQLKQFSFYLVILSLLFIFNSNDSKIINGDNNSVCLSDLSNQIHQILNNPTISQTTWGLRIETLNSSQLLYEQNSFNFFTPASNNKLPTTSAAFVNLNMQSTWDTIVLADPLCFASNAPAPSDSQSCGICLKTSADTTFSYDSLSKLAAYVNFGISPAIQKIDLSVDVSHCGIATPSFPESWEWEDIVSTDGLQPACATVNRNSFDIIISPSKQGQLVEITFAQSLESKVIKVENNAITIANNQQSNLAVFYQAGSTTVQIAGTLATNSKPITVTLAVLQPINHFIDLFSLELSQSNINVNSKTIDICNSTWIEIGRIKSDTLTNIMNETLQESDNLYAETFLRALGAAQSALNTQDQGLQSVKKILTDLGVNTSNFRQFDGSGLSRQNIIAPKMLTELLRIMWQLPNGQIYKSFLPVGGESGTLASRFVGTPAQGRVFAKTGTETGVTALSGYVTPINFENIVFSIIANLSNQSASVLRNAIDSIVILLAELEQC